MSRTPRRRPASGPGWRTWLLAAAGLAAACSPDAAQTGQPPAAADAPQAAMSAPTMYTYRVVNTYPHDPTAFTQGLVFHDGVLYESTGLVGASSLRKVALETGEVIERRPVDARYFAEGLTLYGDRLVQLTWQAGLGFVYDLATLEVARTFTYAGEGWGLTHVEAKLIMSDGSPTLRFLDSASFEEVGRLDVHDRGTPVEDLNELEMVRGEIYANVWQTDRIARISPETGRVTGWIDLAGLLPAAERTSIDAVLNGIAWDEARGRLFVTGKLWPRLFEIAVERRR